MVELVRSEPGADLYRVSCPALDSSSVSAFRARFSDLARPGRTAILDLSAVAFADSAGVGAMLSLMREASEVGGDLKVAAAQPDVRSMFELVRLHHVVDVFNDCEEALRSSGLTLDSSRSLGAAP